jgi:Ca-activated chloride channel family protein
LSCNPISIIMKLLAFIIYLLATIQFAFSQYYVRGELKDEQGNGIQGAKITLASKGSYPFYSGNSGAFGIPSSLRYDTLTFSLDGYDTLRVPVITSDFCHFTLKVIKRNSVTTTLPLASSIKNLSPTSDPGNSEDGETYTSTIENPFVKTKNFPETGFSVHVNRASYSNIRRMLWQKQRPPVDAVRIEEMLNYFNLKTASEPGRAQTFAFNTHITPCWWNRRNQLLFINLRARKLDLSNTPPANLIFLIDVSGSMDMRNRLPLLKSAFKLLIENLRQVDVVSIITYGNEVTEKLQPTCGDQKQKIIEAIEGLQPSGSTAGASAIELAYKLAKSTFIPGGNNRVILATDGDFNVGQSSDSDLEDLISRQSKTGIYLTCLGVGMGNYKDSKLEVLAKKGRGNFAYLDTEAEAEKVLVEEFAQTLYTVANDVYITATFNARAVKEYRLIGFDNNKGSLGDKNIELEGGEVGSGHSLVAAFEISLDKPVDSLSTPAGSTSLASFTLSYKIPGKAEIIQEKHETFYNSRNADKIDSSLCFASSVILFGSLLKQSKFTDGYSWEELYNLASSCVDTSKLVQKEFVALIVRAKKICPLNKKKKG